MKRPLSLLVAALLAAAPAAADKDLWVEKSAKGPRVALPSISPLVKQAGPAVASIYVEAKVGDPIDPNDPRLELFKRFGMQFELPQMPKMQGQGSGFVIHPSGYVLTNNHVVEGAQLIKLRLGGSHDDVEAELVGSDPRYDVALLKLKGDRKDWPTVPLGDSDKLEVGDFVVAIGNPFGLSESVSSGIISARGRRDIAPSGRMGLYDFLQTDASINPGNSGGPLLNLDGEVIGINTAINAAGQGLGFAIPVNIVKQLLPDLRDKGRFARAWIGVGITRVTPEISKGLGLERPRGALVSQVVPNGPAAKAGIEPGDVITRFDGKPIEESTELPLLASFGGVGKAVPVEVVRDGSTKSVKVTLGAAPDEPKGDAKPAKPKSEQSKETGKIGVAVDDLDAELRRQAEVGPKVQGAAVVGVSPGSAAAEAGLKPGDVVVKVDGKATPNADAFVKAVAGAKSGALMKMLVVRKDAQVFIALVKP